MAKYITQSQRRQNIKNGGFIDCAFHTLSWFYYGKYDMSLFNTVDFFYNKAPTRYIVKNDDSDWYSGQLSSATSARKGKIEFIKTINFKQQEPTLPVQTISVLKCILSSIKSTHTFMSTPIYQIQDPNTAPRLTFVDFKLETTDKKFMYDQEQMNKIVTMLTQVYRKIGVSFVQCQQRQFFDLSQQMPVYPKIILSFLNDLPVASISNSSATLFYCSQSSSIHNSKKKDKNKQWIVSEVNAVFHKIIFNPGYGLLINVLHLLGLIASLQYYVYNQLLYWGQYYMAGLPSFQYQGQLIGDIKLKQIRNILSFFNRDWKFVVPPNPQWYLSVYPGNIRISKTTYKIFSENKMYEHFGKDKTKIHHFEDQLKHKNKYPVQPFKGIIDVESYPRLKHDLPISQNLRNKIPSITRGVIRIEPPMKQFPSLDNEVPLTKEIFSTSEFSKPQYNPLHLDEIAEQIIDQEQPQMMRPQEQAQRIRPIILLNDRITHNEPQQAKKQDEELKQEEEQEKQEESQEEQEEQEEEQQFQMPQMPIFRSSIAGDKLTHYYQAKQQGTLTREAIMPHDSKQEQPNKQHQKDIDYQNKQPQVQNEQQVIEPQNNGQQVSFHSSQALRQSDIIENYDNEEKQASFPLSQALGSSNVISHQSKQRRKSMSLHPNQWREEVSFHSSQALGPSNVISPQSKQRRKSMSFQPNQWREGASFHSSQALRSSNVISTQSKQRRKSMSLQPNQWRQGKQVSFRSSQALGQSDIIETQNKQIKQPDNDHPVIQFRQSRNFKQPVIDNMRPSEFFASSQIRDLIDYNKQMRRQNTLIDLLNDRMEQVPNRASTLYYSISNSDPEGWSSTNKKSVPSIMPPNDQQALLRQYFQPVQSNIGAKESSQVSYENIFQVPKKRNRYRQKYQSNFVPPSLDANYSSINEMQAERLINEFNTMYKKSASDIASLTKQYKSQIEYYVDILEKTDVQIQQALNVHKVAITYEQYELAQQIVGDIYQNKQLAPIIIQLNNRKAQVQNHIENATQTYKRKTQIIRQVFLDTSKKIAKQLLYYGKRLPDIHHEPVPSYI